MHSTRPTFAPLPVLRALLFLVYTHARPSTRAALALDRMGGKHQYSVDMEGPSPVVFHETHDI
jgi:hypothetical protein